MGKGLGYHLEKAPLVDANVLTAGTVNPAITLNCAIHPGYSGFVAAQDFTRPYLIVAPELSFTG